MNSTAEAARIIAGHRPDFGAETARFTEAGGRVLAEDILADRAFPPFDRATMDGVAIRWADFEAGGRVFPIEAVQAAGQPSVPSFSKNSCVEIMTGAPCPPGADTVVQYEFLKIEEGRAEILFPEKLRRGLNIHPRASDRRAGDRLVVAGRRLGAAEVSLAAAVGKTEVLVKKWPRVVVVSSGDELVAPDETPLDFQIRRSNSHAVEAVLKSRGIPCELRHIADDEAAVRRELADCLQNFDAVIISGGVSAGRFDHVPAALEGLGVERLFYKVRQRPGKPFWFGLFEKKSAVFAFPGNPVSTFMCLHRYFLPWLDGAVGLPEAAPVFAVLTEDFLFEPPLDYFLQVKLAFSEDGRLLATPVAGNGSGDFANLLEADAFLELPAVERSEFAAGEVFRAWPYRAVF